MKKLSATATIPLWDLWNREKLEIKKEEVGPTVWARGWQMNPQAKTVNQIYYNFSYLNLTSPVECRKEGEIEEAKSVELDTNLPVIISPDFNIGEVDMMCWNILQVRDGIIRVIDEIPLNQVSVYNAMLAFVDRIEASSKHIIVYGDPSGWSKQPNEGRCCFDVIQEVLQRRAQSFELKIVKSWVGATVGHGEGKYINPKPPHRLARHEAVNAKLKNPWTKQPELFIDLAKKLPQEKFTMICPPAESNLSYFKKVRVEAQKVKNLTFIKQVPFKKIDSYFKQAKVFISTSLTEGFPNTFIQAGKNMTPIISFKVNPDKIIINYQLGFCAMGKKDLLSASLKKILTNQKLWLKFSINAYQYVLNHHNLKKTVKSYKEIFLQ